MPPPVKYHHGYNVQHSLHSKARHLSRSPQQSLIMASKSLSLSQNDSVVSAHDSYINQSFVSFQSHVRWTFQPCLTDSTAWRTDRRTGDSIIARYKCCRALKMLQTLYRNDKLHQALSVNCQPQSRLNSPANRLCYKLSRRRQSVPGTCSRHREGVITVFSGALNLTARSASMFKR